MGRVNNANFDAVFSPIMRDQFWRHVEETIQNVFQQSPTIVRDYRKLVDSPPYSEQVLVYHNTPLVVAADLSGARISDITPDQLQRYNDVIDTTGRPHAATTAQR